MRPSGGLLSGGRETFSGKVRRTRPEGDGSSIGQDKAGGEDKGSVDGNGSPFGGYIEDARLRYDSSGDGLLSGVGRWRGDVDVEEGVWKEKSSSLAGHSQYIQKDAGVGCVQVPKTFGDFDAQTKSGTPAVGLLAARDTGFMSFTVARGIDEIPRDQEAPCGATYRMDENSLVAWEELSSAGKDVCPSEDAPVYEFERIRSISGKEVADLPVFNLGTCSGVYEAAGFLVHNCRMPVIWWDRWIVTGKHPLQSYVPPSH